METRNRLSEEETILLRRALEEISQRELTNLERKIDNARNNYYAKIIYVFGIFPLPVVNYGFIYRHFTLNNLLIWLSIMAERLYILFIVIFKSVLRVFSLIAHLHFLNHNMSLMMNSNNFARELLTFAFKSFEGLNLRRNIILENNENIFYIFNTDAVKSLSVLEGFKEVLLNFLSVQIIWEPVVKVDEDGNSKILSFDGPNMNSLIFRFSEILSANFNYNKPLWYMEILAAIIFIIYGIYLFLLVSMSTKNMCISIIKKWDFTQLRFIFTALWPLPGNLF